MWKESVPLTKNLRWIEFHLWPSQHLRIIFKKKKICQNVSLLLWIIHRPQSEQFSIGSFCYREFIVVFFSSKKKKKKNLWTSLKSQRLISQICTNKLDMVRCLQQQVGKYVCLFQFVGTEPFAHILVVAEFKLLLKLLQIKSNLCKRVWMLHNTYNWVEKRNFPCMAAL